MKKLCLIPPTHEAWPDAMNQEIVLQRFVNPSEAVASRQGWWAYSFGYKRYRNPYPIACSAHDIWRESWDQAQLDDGG